MKFNERLNELGFQTYNDYLAGPHWADFKARYKQSDRPNRCVVCQVTDYELHHHTYERLGSELLTDVTPLCRRHHEKVHKMLDKARRGVEDTAWAIGVLAGAKIIILAHPNQKYPTFTDSGSSGGKRRRADVSLWKNKKKQKHP